MYQQSKAGVKLLAIVIAFSFFSVFISGNCIRNTDTSKVYSQSRIFSISDFGICVDLNIKSTEELFPSNIPKITRHQNSRGAHYPRSFIYYLKNNIIFLLAAFILFVIIGLIDNEILSSRRYIIKYIHDQDGPKV